MHRLNNSVCAGVICWLALSPTGESQIKQTVQKLLPATVAVELKTEKPVSGAADQSQGKFVPTDHDYFSQNLTGTAVHPDAGGAADAGGAVRPDTVVDAVSYATGTVVSADGLVVTMLGTEKGQFRVILNNGKKLPAKLVAVDHRTGLQLLKVDAHDQSPVELSTDDVALGEQVATVVCTDVSDRTAATGIITARNRTIGRFSVELLQTDVQIGPMSAGGPLANLRGEVVGILVAGEGETTGLSFAVPSKYVRELLDAQQGEVPVVLQRGYIGVRLNEEDEKTETAFIVEVVEGSPAENAGLRKGDTIISVNGAITSTPSEVVHIIGRHKAGDQVRVTSGRDGETREVDVTLAAYPESKVTDSSATESRDRSFQLLHPSQVIIAGEGGKLYSLDVGVVPGRLKFTQPQQADSPPGADAYESLIKSYNEAINAPGSGGTFLEQPAIRVERSDVEKQLSELTDRVKSLQAEVEKLTEELRSVGEKLGDK